MQRLDIEEAAARVTIGGARLIADEVRNYVRDLPPLWQDADPAGRKSLAANLFATFEAEGSTQDPMDLDAQCPCGGPGESRARRDHPAGR